MGGVGKGKKKKEANGKVRFWEGVVGEVIIDKKKSSSFYLS